MNLFLGPPDRSLQDLVHVPQAKSGSFVYNILNFIDYQMWFIWKKDHLDLCSKASHDLEAIALRSKFYVLKYTYVCIMIL